MPTLQRVAGGATAVGTGVALRETMDVQNGSPNRLFDGRVDVFGRQLDFGRPSVVWGLGSGLAAGLAWYADSTGMVRLPMWADGFPEAYSLTSMTFGAVSAAFPMQAQSGGGGGDIMGTSGRMRPMTNGGAGGAGGGKPSKTAKQPK